MFLRPLTSHCPKDIRSNFCLISNYVVTTVERSISENRDQVVPFYGRYGRAMFYYDFKVGLTMFN